MLVVMVVAMVGAAGLLSLMEAGVVQLAAVAGLRRVARTLRGAREPVVLLVVEFWSAVLGVQGVQVVELTVLAAQML